MIRVICNLFQTAEIFSLHNTETLSEQKQKLEWLQMIRPAQKNTKRLQEFIKCRVGSSGFPPGVSVSTLDFILDVQIHFLNFFKSFKYSYTNVTFSFR